jgi:hypothetical protein
MKILKWIGIMTVFGGWSGAMFLGGAWLIFYNYDSEYEEYKGELKSPLVIGKTSADEVEILLTRNKITTPSMVPTFPIGSWLYGDYNATPKEGDTIIFDCLPNSRCSEFYGEGFDDSYISHRWISTNDDGCMVVLGDNRTINHGEPCYYPDKDIKVIGVSYVKID